MFLNNDVFGIKNNLSRSENFNKKSVVFIENHDENRSAKVFKSKINSTIISFLTMPGMKLIYDGQLEGEKIKYPVQLGKTPEVKVSKKIKEFYDKILEIVNDDVYKKGIFNLVTVQKINTDDKSDENILAWYWKSKEKIILTIVNYSIENSICSISLTNEKLPPQIELNDKLTGSSVKTDSKKLTQKEYSIKLKKYEGKILEINL